MPEQQIRRLNAGASLRRAFVLDSLRRPPIQREVQEHLNMSASGTLRHLHCIERDRLDKAAERVAHTQIWDRVKPK